MAFDGFELFEPQVELLGRHLATIENHCGIVDESYCGNNDQWFMPAFALRDTVIEVNDRICQFRIFAHQPTLTFEETDDLGNEDRGGLGSTGKQ